MAGYMNTMFGNIFEGQFKNGDVVPMYTGMIVELDGATRTMKVPAADTDLKFTCLEKLTIYDGIEAYDFRVDAVPAGKVYYFVDGGFDGNTSIAYDTTEVSYKVGERVSAHPLLVGEKFCATTTNTVVVGTQYSLKANGLIG
jgi:hypothetical protein